MSQRSFENVKYLSKPIVCATGRNKPTSSSSLGTAGAGAGTTTSTTTTTLITPGLNDRIEKLNTALREPLSGGPIGAVDTQNLFSARNIVILLGIIILMLLLLFFAVKGIRDKLEGKVDTVNKQVKDMTQHQQMLLKAQQNQLDVAQNNALRMSDMIKDFDRGLTQLQFSRPVPAILPPAPPQPVPVPVPVPQPVIALLPPPAVQQSQQQPQQPQPSLSLPPPVPQPQPPLLSQPPQSALPMAQPQPPIPRAVRGGGEEENVEVSIPVGTTSTSALSAACVDDGTGMCDKFGRRVSQADLPPYNSRLRPAMGGGPRLGGHGVRPSTIN